MYNYRNWLKVTLQLLFLTTCSVSAPLQSQRYFENNGGLYDHISPLIIPDKNATTIQDVTLDDRGQLSKRNGYVILNSTGTLMTNSVTGGAYHTAATGTSFFAVITGTNVYRTSNSFGGTFTNITGTVTITNASSNLAQDTALNDQVFFANESDNPFLVSSSGNATPLSGVPFTNVKTCATYGNYLVVGNTTESAVSFPSRVRWSDVNLPNTFPTLNYIDVEPNDGDKVISLIAYDDSVFIFKRHSIYRMLITGSDGPDAFIIRPVSRNIGCWAKNSVRIIPNIGIAFLAQNTAYILSANYTEQYTSNGLIAIGDPIQRTFDKIQRSQYPNAVGAVYPAKYQYWLSVSTAGSTNNLVLVYDYIQKGWSTFTNINANMLSQAETVTGANILVSGDYNGNIYEQDDGNSDNPKNVSTAISASYTTADLYMGSPEIRKGFKYLYIFSKADVNTTLTVNTAYDYSTVFESSYPISLGGSGAVYDTAIYDQDVYPAPNYNTSRIELNRSAKAVKLNFMNSSSNSLLGVIGWVIVYSLEDYTQ